MDVEAWSVAWDVYAGCSVAIKAGAALSLRGRCEAGELVCPVPGCEAPRLTTVSGHQRGRAWVNDHFRHLRLVDVDLHTSESAQHLLAKLHVQAWAGREGLDAEVEQFVSEARRRPDVTITDPETGRRLFVEIQYSPLTAEDWSARDRALRSSGDRVLWLWGVRGGRRRRYLTGAQRRCAAETGEVWFVQANGAEVTVALGSGVVKRKQRAWRVGARNADLIATDFVSTAVVSLDVTGLHDEQEHLALAAGEMDARRQLLAELAVGITRLRGRRLALQQPRAHPPIAARPSRPKTTPPPPADMPGRVAAHGREHWGSRRWDGPEDFAKLVHHEHRSDIDVWKPANVWKSWAVDQFLVGRGGSDLDADDIERRVGQWVKARQSIRRPIRAFLSRAVELGYLRQTAPGRYLVNPPPGGASDGR